MRQKAECCWQQSLRDRKMGLKPEWPGDNPLIRWHHPGHRWTNKAVILVFSAVSPATCMGSVICFQVPRSELWRGLCRTLTLLFSSPSCAASALLYTVTLLENKIKVAVPFWSSSWFLMLPSSFIRTPGLQASWLRWCISGALAYFLTTAIRGVVWAVFQQVLWPLGSLGSTVL